MNTEARSDGRREDRYADIIIEGRRDHEHPHATARRVMAVADAEQAEWHRRALAAEEEDHRLTRLLEQRTAALTRTIDAKDAAEARVARLTEQLQHECPHGDMSWTGADQTDPLDEDKVWVCDNCGKRGTRADLNGGWS